MVQFSLRFLRQATGTSRLSVLEAFVTTWAHNLIATTSVLAALGTSSSAALPQRYVVTELEHPDGNGTQTLVPFDINDAGRITGFVFHGFGLDITRQPFIWEDGTVYVTPVIWDYAEAHRLTSSGLAYGIDGSVGTIIQVDLMGMTAIAAGNFNGQADVTHVTDTGHIIVSDGYDGYHWHESTGLTRFFDVPGGNLPTGIEDINSAGVAVGISNIANPAISRATLWQGAEFIDPAPMLSGATRAVGIDEFNHLVLARAAGGFWPGGGPHEIYLASADGDTWDPGEPIYTVSSAYNFEIKSNDAGVIAASWDTGADNPRILMTSESGLDPVELSVPPGMIAVILDGISDGGIAYGRFLDTDYVTIGYVATANDGIRIIGDRLIGSPPLQFYGVARDINASGTMIISWAHNYNYGHWALAEPAMPGDVNGDGTVNVTDLLAIVAAWGPHPVDAACGPDLDINGVVDVEDLLEVLEAFEFEP